MMYQSERQSARQEKINDPCEGKLPELLGHRTPFRVGHEGVADQLLHALWLGRTTRWLVYPEHT